MWVHGSDVAGASATSICRFVAISVAGGTDHSLPAQPGHMAQTKGSHSQQDWPSGLEGSGSEGVRSQHPPQEDSLDVAACSCSTPQISGEHIESVAEADQPASA